MNIPESVNRVPDHSPRHANRKIEDELEASLLYYAKNPHRISARLQELNAEWDVERVLEANAATLALAGTLVGMTRNPKALLLPAAVTGFLLQHAVQGWCPPLSILRRMGVRTRSEIEMERYALKILRGDFEHTAPAAPGGADAHPERDAAAALAAVEK